MTQIEMIARIRVLERLVERLLCRSKKARHLVELGYPSPANDEVTDHIHQQWRNRFSESDDHFDREYRWLREHEALFGGDAA